MRIGIDVGGTNTDAVLMDGATALAGVKHATTPDVTSGIAHAIEDLRRRHGFAGSDIQAVMIGTTHFINALVQAKRLAPTAALRIGLPATDALPPFVDWPTELVGALHARHYLAHGGYEFDGRPISPLDPDELRTHARDMRRHRIRSVAISSVFSPINHDVELKASRVVADELGPHIAISLSHEIGKIGLLERENATIINAALRELAGEIVGGLAAAVGSHGIDAPIFFSQNDGTLMNEGFVRRYPVATFASGPTNSMRGAAAISGMSTCAVIDVGGTTTDIGLLIGGFPRKTASVVRVAGIRTNFRMPDVLSIGIGGGSIVDVESGEVGPESVGYRLTSQALVFGGSTLTATDIAVAAGRANVGDPSKVAHVDADLVQRVLDRVAERIAEAVDRMRTSAEPIPVVAVGGGSILLPDELPIFGAVHRPQNYAVANAIGASIAQISGQLDTIIDFEADARAATIAALKQQVIAKAVAAGARADTVAIVDFDEVPIPYLPGNATRVSVKAVGDLELGT
ncbi:hydantoinase/oxoprolinase N-terminal domain-containing protein [Mycobacterium decipiens]|uniref:Hydantoinase subunit beta n=1 Tax=Mycobacterium decipiens TaxID=1430326 RepID=A0A1X2LZX0_9MYCO|nr:hydantoinase/oxoprolinase family protein [Mycobacterium decipiens]OSC42924.1 hydantoinase subunit beta [Mycobacterium decipiens]